MTESEENFGTGETAQGALQRKYVTRIFGIGKVEAYKLLAQKSILSQFLKGSVCDRTLADECVYNFLLMFLAMNGILPF